MLGFDTRPGLVTRALYISATVMVALWRFSPLSFSEVSDEVLSVVGAAGSGSGIANASDWCLGGAGGHTH